MKSTKLLPLAVVALAALVAGASGTAQGSSRPLGHVVGSVKAEVAQHGPHPTFVAGTYEVRVNAFDRTIDPSIHPFTPTEDEGTLVVATPFGTFTYAVVNVWISDDGSSASLFVGEGIVFRVHDGGAPGNQAVGPPDPAEAGLSPTRDWFEQRSFTSGIHFSNGFVTAGNIAVSVAG